MSSFIGGLFAGKSTKSAPASKMPSGKPAAAPKALKKKKKEQASPHRGAETDELLYREGCIRTIQVADPTAPADQTDLPVCAVVVTLCADSSYDTLFESVPQKVDGGRVAVFGVKMAHISAPVLAHHLFESQCDGEQGDDEEAAAPPSQAYPALSGSDVATFASLRQDIAAVDPECVVFNFECCGACSSAGFLDGFSHAAHKGAPLFARRAVDKGFMVMFSDFSLKALIAEWDTALLGPKPFVEEGEGISSTMTLRFLPEELKECPSTQLAAVGELCSEGTAEVHAMPSTIRYNFASGADEGAARNPASPACAYDLKVLTRVTRCDNTRRTGLGHTTLTYPSGGVILTSCGHWVELQKLDTTFEALQKMVCEQEGSALMDDFVVEYEKASQAERPSMLRSKAAKCVQKSAPCKTKKKMMS